MPTHPADRTDLAGRAPCVIGEGRPAWDAFDFLRLGPRTLVGQLSHVTNRSGIARMLPRCTNSCATAADHRRIRASAVFARTWLHTGSCSVPLTTGQNRPVSRTVRPFVFCGGSGGIPGNTSAVMARTATSRSAKDVLGECGGSLLVGSRPCPLLATRM